MIMLVFLYVNLCYYFIYLKVLKQSKNITRKILHSKVNTEYYWQKSVCIQYIWYILPIREYSSQIDIVQFGTIDL